MSRAAAWVAVPMLIAICSIAQNADNERSFPASASIMKAMIKKLPGGTSGPLPVLEGFVIPGTRSLNRYRRPYYECSVRVTSDAAGSRVNVAAKITAWDSDPAHPGYEVFLSNGRIESDLLDRLQDALASNSLRSDQTSLQASKASAAKTEAANADTPKADQRLSVPRAKADPPPDIDAPVRQLPSIRDIAPMISRNASPADPALEREARNLEDILRNQSHPTNLVAVRKEETPILQSPRTDATVLFLANAQDEFEVLSVNSNWVYVRISGLARGWIRKSSIEVIDDSVPTVSGPSMLKTVETTETAASPPSGLFAVNSEQVGSFPGEWAPLKGKNVEIVSVQPATGVDHITSAQEKLQFAEMQFKQESQGSSSTAGMVLIFDSQDGGMVAATQSSLEQWKTGAISDGAFWKQCYFDPPETFAASQ